MNKSIDLTMAFFVAVLIIGIWSLCGFCWDYSINTALDIAGKDTQISWWAGYLIALVPGFGQISVPVAVVAWIVTLFV